MNKHTIYTTVSKHEFIGKHLPDRERPNWHYYESIDGTILHFRKEHIVCVIEKTLEEQNG